MHMYIHDTWGICVGVGFYGAHDIKMCTEYISEYISEYKR